MCTNELLWCTLFRLLQNRQSAALSRQRKKEYIVSIEKKNAEIERALEKANQRIVDWECLIAPEVLATLPVYKPEEKSSDDLRLHKDDDDDDDDDDDVDDDEDSHGEGEGLSSDDNNISIDATGDEEMKELTDHSNGEEMKKDWKISWLIFVAEWPPSTVVLANGRLREKKTICIVSPCILYLFWRDCINIETYPSSLYYSYNEFDIV